ncbi:hypothetical protein DRN32_00690 [Thermococci archaeon]|nr:MAG: hypothetical protein DRN32_00690 [Thermococci archaeon]
MKRLLAGMLLLGSLFLSLATAANGISLLSCWYPWDHDSDVRQWSDNEWVWAGIHGQVEVCDGQFQRILTNTVYAVTEWSGVNGEGKKYTDPYGRYAYAKVYYQRYSGETGVATAYIPNLYR